MSELLEAAKAVIEGWKDGYYYCTPMNKLRAAVERAESDAEIDRQNQEAMAIHLSGVRAERERIKDLLRQSDEWFEGDQQAQANWLLEKIDATTE